MVANEFVSLLAISAPMKPVKSIRLTYKQSCPDEGSSLLARPATSNRRSSTVRWILDITDSFRLGFGAREFNIVRIGLYYLSSPFWILVISVRSPALYFMYIVTVFPLICNCGFGFCLAWPLWFNKTTYLKP